METSWYFGIFVMQKNITSSLAALYSFLWKQYKSGEKMENMWKETHLEKAKCPFRSIKKPFCLL